MEAEGLESVCAGLGYTSLDPGLPYIKSQYCLENLKSLQRYLRRDHPTSRPVFQLLGKWNTVGRDLVPIIAHYRDDPELILNAVKVVVFLTMPVDPLSENVTQQMEYLLDFKASFLHNDVIAVIITLLEEPLEHLESDTFSEDDWKVIQLVLTLIRNLLDIQGMSLQKFLVNENSKVLSIRDKLLEHMFEENVMDLLLALAQHVSGPVGLLRQDSILFLEIFHHIFCGQSPEKLARATLTEKTLRQPGGLLRVITEEEQERLKDIRLKDLSCHYRFSGSFVRLAQDGSKTMLKCNPFQSPIDSVLRGPEVKHGPVKRVACDRSSSASEGRVLGLLKTFADQLMLGSYNVVMQAIKDDITRERTWIQPVDVKLFFEVAKFLTTYCRCSLKLAKVEKRSKGFTSLSGLDVGCPVQLCGPIASTMDEDMFTMVVSRWHTYSEAAKETNDWVSLFVTGSLFKEMVRMLDVVMRDAHDNPGSNSCKQQEARVTRILLYKIFYDQTENGTFRFLLHLLRTFDAHKQPRSHLADLIETVHVVLRLVEFLTKEDGALRVLKTSRKRNKNKTEQKGMEQEQSQRAGNNTNVSEASDMSAVVSGAIADDCTPDNMDGKHAGPSPVNLHESCDADGIQDAATQSDNLAARNSDDEDLNTCLEGSERAGFNDMSGTDYNGEGKNKERHHVEDGSENEGPRGHVEVFLDVHKCATMFADNTVIHNYCWLLKSFTSNTAAINHYIVCMLQRICRDYSLEPMLFQLSLLQIFYEILSNKKASKVVEHQRLFAFLTKVIRSFFKKLRTQPLLFLDVLFWKTRQDCHLITTEYKIHTVAKISGKWKKSLSPICIADALGIDEGGDPCAAQSEQGAKKSIKESDCMPKVARRRRRGLFTPEQEVLLMERFERYKDSPEGCRCVTEEIDPEGKIMAAHIPCLKRQKMRKQVEGHGHRKKRCGKNSNRKCEEELQEEIDTNGETSEDETLTQLMEKVRSSKAKKGLSPNPKRKCRTKPSVTKKDETIHDQLARRELEAVDIAALPCLKRQKMRKQVEGHGHRKKRGGENRKCEKELQDEIDANGESSEDERLIQLMEKVRSSKAKKGLSPNPKRKCRTKPSVTKKDDETIHDQLARRELEAADIAVFSSEDNVDMDESLAHKQLEDDVEDVMSDGDLNAMSILSGLAAPAGQRRRTLFSVFDEEI